MHASLTSTEPFAMTLRVGRLLPRSSRLPGLSLYRSVSWSPGLHVFGNTGVSSSTCPAPRSRCTLSSRTGLLAKGVISKSSAAIVVPTSAGAGLEMNLSLHKNAGAARNSLRDPLLRPLCNDEVEGPAEPGGRYGLLANSFGLTPRRAGSPANAASRFTG